MTAAASVSLIPSSPTRQVQVPRADPNDPLGPTSPEQSGRLLRRTASRRHPMRLQEHVVLRKISKLLIPFVIVFGIYVITHGEIGPGGGFQGGVIVRITQQS